jgi:hypothetical protein
MKYRRTFLRNASIAFAAKAALLGVFLSGLLLRPGKASRKTIFANNGWI